jgi:hypothetical protein
MLAVRDTLAAPDAEPPQPTEAPVEPLVVADPPVDAMLGVLPPAQALGRGRVETYLASARVGLPEDGDFPDRRYRPRLALDYISQPTAGIGYDPYYGVGLGGGIAMRFSDMLGDNVLGVVVQANGSFKDIGGQVMYLNQRRRLNWGGMVTHVPFLQVYVQPISVGDTGQFFLTRLYQRTYVSQVGGLAAYPLSQTRRVEGNLGVTRYAYEVEIDLPDQTGRIRRVNAERELGFELPDPLTLAEAGVALRRGLFVLRVHLPRPRRPPPLRGGRHGGLAELRHGHGGLPGILLR